MIIYKERATCKYCIILTTNYNFNGFYNRNPAIIHWPIFAPALNKGNAFA